MAMNSQNLHANVVAGDQPTLGHLEAGPNYCQKELLGQREKVETSVGETKAGISWRTVLQQMYLNSETNGLSREIAETRVAAIIRLLADNNYNLGWTVDVLFISHISNTLIDQGLYLFSGGGQAKVDPIL